MFEAQEKAMEDKAATARTKNLQPISEFSKTSESMIMKHYWISMAKQGPTTTLAQHKPHEWNLLKVRIRLMTVSGTEAILTIQLRNRGIAEVLFHSIQSIGNSHNVQAVKKYEQSSHLGKDTCRVCPQVFCRYKSIGYDFFSYTGLCERGVIDPAREEIL